MVTELIVTYALAPLVEAKIKIRSNNKPTEKYLAKLVTDAVAHQGYIVFHLAEKKAVK